MSTTYNGKVGDTPEVISRRVYGTEAQADRVRQANPGVVFPLQQARSLVTPTVANTGNAPRAAGRANTQGVPADNDKEVTILIAGRRFRYWDSVRITRTLDRMDTVEVGGPFEPDQAEHRTTFEPFTYKPLEVLVGGTPLFTGTMVAVDPVSAEDSQQFRVSGYSTPGVLNDCPPPPTAYPVEFQDLGLEEIAQKICEPFGITPVFEAEEGEPFERVANPPETNALAFLSRLAAQRNLVVASTTTGELLFWQTEPAGGPVAKLDQGTPPLVSVANFFNPQQYYSHVTGIESVVVGTQGSQFTVENPRLAGVTRPYTFAVTDTKGEAVEAAVNARAGRMFGNMASYRAKVSTWRDAGGKLWAPNTTVSVRAPGAMVYRSYDFVVRGVEFVSTANGADAELDLVLPGSFNGELPEALPWDP